MGTRGAIGFYIDGRTIATYNHFDSYPEALGNAVVRDLRGLLQRYSVDALKNKVRALRIVTNENETPSAVDIARFRRFRNAAVSTGEDWYSLLREMQGELAKYVEAGVIIDSTAFLKDSLFCEWAYLLNLDDQCFEIYRGFQRKRHHKGRYDAPKRRGWKPQYKGQHYYYPVALVVSVPFADIVADWIEENEEEPDEEDGTSGQDRESYSDDQDRESYVVGLSHSQKRRQPVETWPEIVALYAVEELEEANA